MSTVEEVNRWREVFSQSIDPIALSIAILSKAGKPFPHLQAVELTVSLISDPIIGHWEVAQPVADSNLYSVIFPVVEAVRNLDKCNLQIEPIAAIVDRVAEARAQLDSNLSDSETADEVVREMIITLKVLVITARLGHQGIMHLLGEHWDERIRHTQYGGAIGLPEHLDLMNLKSTKSESAVTIAFSNLLTTVDPGIITFDEYVNQDNAEPQTATQSHFAGRWIVTFFTEWELSYRKRLATIHDCSERSVRSELLQDLGYMRNDFAHNRGIASSKQKKCKRLKWFNPGDRMQPSQANYEQLFVEFERERDVFTRKPAPYTSPKVELKAHVPLDLVDKFNGVVAQLGMGKDEALEVVISSWCEANE